MAKSKAIVIIPANTFSKVPFKNKISSIPTEETNNIFAIA
jgi:hypothetical protein